MLRLNKPMAAALALMAGLVVTPAFAANAFMLQDSDVYEEASNNSDVVNDVSEGDAVTVTDCQGNYCYIKIPGDDGWVRQNRLGMLDKGGNPNPKIPFSFGFSVGGPDGPQISIGVGNKPKPPKLKPQVCFYRDSNFGGKSFCVEPGDSDDSLSGSWDDSISSIKVLGNAEVTVCRDEDLSGICATITSSKSSLPSKLNNRISSYEVD